MLKMKVYSQLIIFSSTSVVVMQIITYRLQILNRTRVTSFFFFIFSRWRDRWTGRSEYDDLSKWCFTYRRAGS